MKLQAEWTDDCQGKKDYDGDILSISTRYWPRGGGFWLVEIRPDGSWGDETRPHILPSAKSSLLLRHDDHDYTTLVEQEFEAETQEEVQRQVEEWAQAQMDRVVAILRQHYTF